MLHAQIVDEFGDVSSACIRDTVAEIQAWLKEHGFDLSQARYQDDCFTVDVWKS